MGYTKFAIRYVSVAGDIMPKCCGDRVIELDISKKTEIILQADKVSTCLFAITPYEIDEDDITTKSPVDWNTNDITVNGALVDIRKYTVVEPFHYLTHLPDGQICFLLSGGEKMNVDLKTISNKYSKVKIYMYDLEKSYTRHITKINIVPNPHKVFQNV